MQQVEQRGNLSEDQPKTLKKRGVNGLITIGKWKSEETWKGGSWKEQT